MGEDGVATACAATMTRATSATGTPDEADDAMAGSARAGGRSDEGDGAHDLIDDPACRCYDDYLAFARRFDPYAHAVCAHGDVADDPAAGDAPSREAREAGRGGGRCAPRELDAHDLNDCPAMRTMEMLAGKWRLKVLFRLTLRPSLRFSELKRAIPGITSAMLTTALRDLEGYGVVRREQFSEMPPRVEYSLTEGGRQLYPVFYEMARWAVNNLGTPGDAGRDDAGRDDAGREREASRA